MKVVEDWIAKQSMPVQFLIIFGTIAVIVLMFVGFAVAYGFTSLGECRHYQAFNEDGVMYGEWFLKGQYIVERCDGAT